MSHSSKFKQLYLIANTLKSNSFPTLDELKTKLDRNDIYVSTRTLQRCLEDLESYYGLKVKYSHSKKGYYFDSTDLKSNEDCYQLLEMAYTSQFLMSEINEKDKYNHFFHFEKNTLRGLEQLPTILKAIKTKQKLRFSYFNFRRNTSDIVTIHPYLLKEYQKRWYVIGFTESKDAFRTYGLDRIENIETLSELFKENKSEEIKNKLERVIGINYNIGDLETVRLSFTPFQAKYIISQPWHSSQEIESETETEVIICFQLEINFELEQRILMNAEGLKVLQPESLRNRIKERLETTLSKYR